MIYELDDYIMSLKTPWEVKAIADGLRAVTKQVFRQEYFSIDQDDYGFAIGEEDYEYTWSWFQGVRELYYRAAEAGRYVLFTASQ